MSLFSILGVPAFTLFAFALARWLSSPLCASTGSNPKARLLDQVPLRSALWGFLYGIPGMLLSLLAARIFALSYRPFLLYLHYTMQDHFFPVLFIVVSYFAFLRGRDLLELAFFTAGYFTLTSFGWVIAGAGQRDAYNLFLLPATRMAAVFLLPFLFTRCREWYGLFKILVLVLMVILPLFGGLIAFLYMRFWGWWASVAAAAVFAASLALVLYNRRP